MAGPSALPLIVPMMKRAIPADDRRSERGLRCRPCRVMTGVERTAGHETHRASDATSSANAQPNETARLREREVPYAACRSGRPGGRAPAARHVGERVGGDDYRGRRNADTEVARELRSIGSTTRRATPNWRSRAQEKDDFPQGSHPERSEGSALNAPEADSRAAPSMNITAGRANPDHLAPLVVVALRLGTELRGRVRVGLMPVGARCRPSAEAGVPVTGDPCGSACWPGRQRARDVARLTGEIELRRSVKGSSPRPAWSPTGHARAVRCLPQGRLRQVGQGVRDSGATVQ